MSSHALNSSHKDVVSAQDKVVEPSSYKDAATDPKWITAMEEELTALSKNGTWELTNLPVGKRAIGCKWVYKIKLNADGSIQRYKARLVAKGSHKSMGWTIKKPFHLLLKWQQ